MSSILLLFVQHDMCYGERDERPGADRNIAAAVREMRANNDVDRLEVVIVPDVFAGVGGSYEDFSQTPDEEVTCFLNGVPVPV